jgi:hypothetical protein
MAAVDDDVAAGGEDVAHDLCCRKDPSLERCVFRAGHEGGIGLVEDHDVGGMAGSKALLDIPRLSAQGLEPGRP